MLLYLHIRFCEKKCHYCSFNSYIGKFHLKPEYFKAIVEQLKFEIERFNVKKGDIETLFIGGGTPSTIEYNLYEKFFTEIYPYLKKDAEITTEANPNSSDKKWLKGMKELGVNRISFGVQSFNEKKLKFLGRNHSCYQAKKAVKDAYEIGIKDISIDLIYGCTLDTKRLLEDDLNSAFLLPINHISTYALSIEKGTKFERAKITPKQDIEMIKYFYKMIENRGFKQYEISNFGKKSSSHNLGYWSHKDYIGIGAGAVGFLKNSRFYPAKNIQTYIQNPLHCKIEHLSKEDIKTEKIFLGFRSIVGVDEKILNANELKRAKILEHEGKLKYKNGKFYNQDYLLSDEIALFVMT